MRWILIASLGWIAAAPSPRDREIWLVFSPESPLPMERLRKGPKPDRLVLAIEDYRTGGLPDSFLKTVGDLQKWMGRDFDLPVCDAEALDVLRRLNVRRLPALLLFDGGTTHIVEGIPRSLKEVLECDR